MTQISITVSVKPAAAERQLYWIPHDRFRYDYDDRGRQHSRGWAYNAAGDGSARLVTRETGQSMPEVYRFLPEHATVIPLAYKDLLCDLNPMLSQTKTLDLLRRGVAWTNSTDGVFDFPRLCGGTVVEGRDADDKVWIKTMLLGEPAPSAQFVLDNFLSYIATEVRPDGGINLIHRRGMDGQLYPVRMIMLTSEPIFAYADEVLKLPPGFIPPSPFWTPLNES
jgi:hypothetical protein